MRDGQGNSIGTLHEGDGTPIQTLYQGDGTELWSATADILGGEIYQNSTWTVHQRPRAIRAGDYTFIGGTESDGDIKISAYDHTDGSVQDRILGTGTADDHTSPSIYIRDDDRLVVFWTDRPTDDSIYWKISDNGLDISSWGTEQSFSTGSQTDYPEPVPWEGDLRVYYRKGGGSTADWKYRVSTDGGSTFGSEQDFLTLDDDWIYTHVWKDTTQTNDRLHYALGDHRMSNTGIYHWYLEDGAYYQSDGTKIQDTEDTSPSGTVVESFEDGDISEYSGDTGIFSTNTNAPVSDGSYSLKSDPGDNPSFRIISTSGLDAYPAQGDTFSARLYLDGSSKNPQPGLCFGASDYDNFYVARIDGQNDNFQLYLFNDGATLLDEVSISVTTDIWYEVEIDWATDDTITCTLYDDGGSVVNTISATDSTHASNTGIGWYEARDLGNGSAYDYLVIGDSGSSGSTELTTLSDLTQVYDGTASGNNPAKQYDLITDANGNPHVAFTEHVTTGTGGGDGDYRARWAAWDGSVWTVGSEVTPMGGALPETHYYEGGLSLDKSDPTTVYVSVEQENRNYQIQEWTTNDEGSAWSKTEDLSPADAGEDYDPTKRGRPISPYNNDGSELQVLWWEGLYDDFEGQYDTDVHGIE